MGPSSARLFLRTRRKVNLRLAGRPPTRSYASLDAEARVDGELHDPTPSELLRAALTTPSTTVTGNDWHSGLRERTIMLLDCEWKSSSPPPALWCALKRVHPMYLTEHTQRLYSAADLGTVRHAIERLVTDGDRAAKLQGRNCETLRQALLRCRRCSTYAQILSTLRDTIARLQRLGLLIRPQLFELAMYYAALDLSPSALRQLLQEYGKIRSSRGTPRTGGLILRALLDALESEIFENPRYDTSVLRTELTGTKPYDRTTLATLLGSPRQDRKTWSLYLCILAKIQSKNELHALWKIYLAAQKNEDEGTYHSAYDVIVALIQAGRSNTAVNFLENISKRSKDSLPYIATFRNLQPLIDDSIVGEALPDLVRGQHYEQLLEFRLKNIEQRLGIQWLGSQAADEHGTHISVALESSWAIFKDHPLLTIDGDSAGYDDPARLYPELKARGCSSSVDDLGQIIHLLNDQSGHVQRVFPNVGFDKKQLKKFRTEFPTLALRWGPEHSPIEFPDSPLPALSKQPQEWTPASLGLMRARPMINDVPQGGTKCLHLLQLGSMDMRLSPSEPWRPSGYIVAWDRQHGEMIALFVGKNYGLVDPGPTPTGSPFGTVMRIRPSTVPNTLPSVPSHLQRDSADPYYLDLDPSADLGFR